MIGRPNEGRRTMDKELECLCWVTRDDRDYQAVVRALETQRVTDLGVRHPGSGGQCRGALVSMGDRL